MKTNQAANQSMPANQASLLPDDTLDRLLHACLASPAELIAPSSGFAGEVMEAIEAQAAAPPPIAFPWRRVMPGAIAVLCGLAAFASLIAHGRASGAGTKMALKTIPTLSSFDLALCWIAAAILVSIATVAASLRLAGHSR